MAKFKMLHKEGKMKVLSLFSGIGAFEKALSNLNLPCDLIGFSEIDKYAVKSYCEIHNVDESKNLGDITKIDETALPKNIDLITYGFPCQDISLAGKQKGLFNEDGTQTRSGLFFDALRIIEATKQRIAIAENVKNLTSKKFSEQFEIVLNSLEEAGYNNYWQVLNAKDYGIPQNRERVFIVSIRKDIDNGTFKFPEGFPLELRLKDMLEDVVDEKFYLSPKMIHYISQSGTAKFKNPDCKINLDIERPLTTALDKRAGTSNYIGDNLPSNYDLNEIKGEPVIKQVGQMYGTEREPNPQAGRVYDADGISPTLDSCSGGNRMPKIAAEPTIQRVDIPQTVKVRKYPVDCKLLCECLRYHKSISNFSNKEIADALNISITKVEHWFRKDECFAIPDAEVWMDLKKLLGIETDEFDASITTFEEKEGVYEKSERHYSAEGIMPTLTSATAGCEKILVKEATKKGYAEAVEGDSINFEQPNSKTRRGRGGHGVAQTLTTSTQQGVVVNPLNAMPDGTCRTIKNQYYKTSKANFERNSTFGATGVVVETKPVCLNSKGGRGGIEGLQPSLQDRVYDSNATSTAVTPSFMPSFTDGLRIRKLTPKECWRLMGFDDSDFEKAEKVNSNTQLYKQAGNSIVVPVVEYIIRALIDCDALKKE